ncbi:MAG: D-aminoacyl-tRNA deacylase [Verrucomicrobiota bacterium]|nr:D-aminoacyl-tRNA deacylase [Verrucomicrobiota bacterium]
MLQNKRMKLVVQRVKAASVEVEGKIVGEIGIGLLVLVGVSREDTVADGAYLAKKTVNLRIFDDAAGQMNRSVLDIGGAVLAVSQFTLYGDCKKGNRPSYINAARPEKGLQFYEEYVKELRGLGPQVETGIFQTDMKVSLINNGPVTLILESTGRQ